MLTRSDFDQACKAYVDAHHNARTSGLKDYPTGWTWNEHPVCVCENPPLAIEAHAIQYVPNLGYLSRTVYLPRTSMERTTLGEYEDHVQSISDEDDAVCHIPEETQVCNQYIVYSATFGVPAFYFTLHHRSAW